MKKLILILIIASLGFTCLAQKDLESGITGLEMRNTINANFDTIYKKSSFDSTLYINGRTRQVITDLEITGADTINYRNLDLTVPAPLGASTVYTIDHYDVYLTDNDVEAGPLRFQNGYHELFNETDSINIIFDWTNVTKTNNGDVRLIQRGFSQNTHVYADGTDSSYVKRNVGILSKNQLEPTDAGSYVHVESNETMSLSTIIGDDGELEVDSTATIYSIAQVDAKTGSIINMDKLYGFRYHLEDVNTTGTVNINDIVGLEIVNKDGRQGDNSTIGFYENFGDNYFTNNIETAESVTIGDVLKITPQGTAPSSPELGWIYVSSADNHIYFYNGTGWVQMDN